MHDVSADSLGAGEEVLMERTITLIVAGTLGSIGILHAQETQPVDEQEQQHGIPASPHQEQAVREIGSDLFTRLDANGDGSISRSEAEAEAEPPRNGGDYDENGDQQLDHARHRAHETTSNRAGGGADIAEAEAEGGETIEGLAVSPHQREAL